MFEKLIDTIARMWASHPEAANFALHWGTLETELDAEGNTQALELAKAIRNRAAEVMQANRTESGTPSE